MKQSTSTILIVMTLLLGMSLSKRIYTIRGASDPTINALLQRINSEGRVTVNGRGVSLGGYCNSCSTSFTEEGTGLACTEMWCNKDADTLEQYAAKILSENKVKFVTEQANETDFKVKGKSDWIRLVKQQ